MELTKRETATVLAALRYWQREGWRSSGVEIEIACAGYDEPLDSDAIDSICAQIESDNGAVRQKCLSELIELNKGDICRS